MASILILSLLEIVTIFLLPAIHPSNGLPCAVPEDPAIDPPLCDQIRQANEELSDLQEEVIYNQFAALNSRSLFNMHPARPRILKALQRYDESPFPIPAGPSLYFCTLILVGLAWLIKYCVWKSLSTLADDIELYPETSRFPHVHLYSLQQSKREARLRREARNTWAWMATNYILLPNDPRVNTSVFNTTWSDFDLPKDVWPVVRAVMKVNAWYLRAKDRVGKGQPLKKPPKSSNGIGNPASQDVPNKQFGFFPNKQTVEISPEVKALNERLEKLRANIQTIDGYDDELHPEPVVDKTPPQPSDNLVDPDFPDPEPPNADTSGKKRKSNLKITDRILDPVVSESVELEVVDAAVGTIIKPTDTMKKPKKKNKKGKNKSKKKSV